MTGQSLHAREAIEEALDAGRYLDAWRMLQEISGPHVPADPALLEPGLRALASLDLDARWAWWVRAAARRAPQSLLVWAHHTMLLMQRGRVVEALRILRWALPSQTAPLERLRWHSFRAGIWTQLRDFESAWREIAEARSIQPDHHWLAGDEAWLLFESDHRDKALVAARAGVQRHPRSARLHALLCHALHEADDPAAVEETALACARFQLPSLWLFRALVLLERERPEEALSVAEQLRRFFPVEDRRRKAVLHGLLARIHRRMGGFREALHHARAAGKPLEQTARALEAAAAAVSAGSPPPPMRVLAVPFVRQDMATCAPASMAAALRALGWSVEQRAVADEITYDGTADYDTRAWSLRQGLVHREFRFHGGTVRALVDRGLPVLLVTRFPFGAHMQVVAGYDQAMGSLIVREPSRHATQDLDEAVLEREDLARGYRCVIVFPPERAASIEGIGLPQEADVTLLTSLRQALHEHRLADALELRARMESPKEDPIATLADAELAGYLARPEDILAAVGRLLARYGDDAWVREKYATLLPAAGRPRELRAMLLGELSRPEGDPALLVHVVEAFAARRRDQPAARRAARRLLRGAPLLGRAWTALARLLSCDPATQEEALVCRRVASCLDPFNENVALECFDALRDAGRDEEGLAWLRERVARHGGRSGAPHGTLGQALRALHREEEAGEVLREGLRLHEESWLRIQLFHSLMAAGRRAEARELVQASAGRMRPVDLHLLRSRLSLAEGDRRKALDALGAATRESPGHVGIQRERLEILGDVEGLAAAAAEAAALARALPDHPAFAEMEVSWLRRIGRGSDAEAALRARLATHPEEGWAVLELASVLRDAGRLQEALAFALEVADQHPAWSRAHALAASLLASQGRRAEADAAFRRAISLDATNVFALYQGLQNTEEPGATRDLIRFHGRELHRQGPHPEAVEAFVDLSGNLLPPREVRERLDLLVAEYPGRPAPREALVQLLLRQRNLEGAVEAARAAVDAFPHRVQTRLLLVRALLAAHDRPGAERAARAAVRQDPLSEEARTLLGETLEARGRMAEAAEVYREGMAFLPGSARIKIFAADVAWRSGRADDALHLLEAAEQLDPGGPWILRKQVEWRIVMGRRPEALRKARAGADAHGRIPEAWEALGQACIANGLLQEAAFAFRQALELDPRMGGARWSLVTALAELHRSEEAWAALEEGVRLDPEDPEMATLRAWLLSSEGDMQAAAEAMRPLAHAAPQMENRWAMLAWWWRQLGRGEEILADAEHAVRLGVECEDFWELAVAVALERGEAGKALVWLRQAVARGARGEWALPRLAHLLEERGRTDEVAALFEDLDLAHASQETVACALGAAFRKRDEAAARSALEHLLAGRTSFDAAALLAAWDAIPFRALGRVEDWLKELHGRGDTGLSVGVHLLGALNPPGWRRRLRRLMARVAREPRGGRWVEAALDCLLEADKAHLLADVVEHDLPRELEDPSLWGAAGLALRMSLRPQVVVARMLPDFRRPDAEGWALFQLAAALAALDRVEEMEDVLEVALAQPRDQCWWWLRALKAWALLRRGRAAEAAPWAEVPVPQQGHGRALVSMVGFLAAVGAHKDPAAWRSAFEASLPGALEDPAVPRLFPPLWRAYVQAARRHAPCLASWMLRWGPVGRFLLRHRPAGWWPSAPRSDPG